MVKTDVLAPKVRYDRAMRRIVGCSLFLLACNGGGDPCTEPSKCSADPAPNTAQCENLFANVCGDKWKDFASCQHDHTVCGSDNKTDITATDTAVNQSCSNQAVAIVLCCAQHADAGNCPFFNGGGNDAGGD
jgi:hypothetical protein